MLEDAKKFIDRRILGKENPNLQNRVGLTWHPNKGEGAEDTILTLKYRGQSVGYAHLERQNNKLYVLINMHIYEKFRGNDFGGNLIDAVNNFLDERDAVGILTNAIKGPAKNGLYKRHGWRKGDAGTGILGEDIMHYTPKEK